MNLSINPSKKQPVAALAEASPRPNHSRKSVSWKNEGYVPGDVRRARGERPPSCNPNGAIVCYTCGKEGHIARECHSSLKKPSPYSEISKQLGNMQEALDKLSAESAELRAANKGVGSKYANASA